MDVCFESKPERGSSCCEIIRRMSIRLKGHPKAVMRAWAVLKARTEENRLAASREFEQANALAARLFDTYGNSILRLAYSYVHNMSDAEEILQDTLLAFLQKKPAIGTPEQEKAWLLRVAANKSKNRIAYNRVREHDELEETLAAEEREDLSFVWDAVKQLPQQLAQTVHLFYYEGCSTAEIAQILKRNENSVRSDLHRARQKLKSVLKEVYDFE